MGIILRWGILVVAFVFGTAVVAMSREFFPPSFLAGYVRAALFILFMAVVWNVSKRFDNRGGVDRE